MMETMKKVSKDPFSNGTEYMFWEERNCDRCWKSSHIRKGSDPDYPEFTKVKCAIQRDIFDRMMDGCALIRQRTIDICRKSDCPYRQERRPVKKYEKYKNEPKLFDI